MVYTIKPFLILSMKPKFSLSLSPVFHSTTLICPLHGWSFWQMNITKKGKKMNEIFYVMPCTWLISFPTFGYGDPVIRIRNSYVSFNVHSFGKTSASHLVECLVLQILVENETRPFWCYSFDTWTFWCDLWGFILMFGGLDPKGWSGFFFCMWFH